MKKIEWHYPREEFLKLFYQGLIHGPGQAVAMFGRRRIGKTQFMLKDLGPYAEEKGHKVVYMNFQELKTAPIMQMLYEMDQALRGDGFIDRVGRWLSEVSGKIKLREPSGHGEIEITLPSLREKPREDYILLLDRFLDELYDPDKPAILIFDEFQDIATNPGGKVLIAALRSALDKRRDGIAAVFTGSSQNLLRQMFSKRDAPFYRYATAIDLPRLESDFVDHQLVQFRKVFKYELDDALAQEYFERFDNNPDLFQRWLNQLSFSNSPEAAREAVEDNLIQAMDIQSTILALPPVARAVLRLIAEGHGGVYGEAAQRRLETLLGEPVSQSSVQGATRLLEKRGLIENWPGEGREISDAYLFSLFSSVVVLLVSICHTRC